MGFRETRAAILKAIDEGRVAHELRTVQSEKNLLAAEEISLARARQLILRARGNQAASAPHHLSPAVTVWILRPKESGVTWYIKCYLRGADLIFISFHPEEVQP